MFSQAVNRCGTSRLAVREGRLEEIEVEKTPWNSVSTTLIGRVNQGVKLSAD
jgi:hypothetical protein